ncbi:hypothetical protein [Adhaeribacter terreus]|uniref:Glycosyltransferase family 4 protein n=1 Tax=Adhaeribacter terreus TaxID=529703 RepID=A0ABW0E513_9BACT
MTILYLCYWSINDALTVATCFPNLKILNNFTAIEKIVFITIERNFESEVKFAPSFKNEKIEFKPLHSSDLHYGVLNKINDFVSFPKELAKLVQHYKVDKIIARGAPAGALAYLVWKKLKTPFLVESFEPHADYMLESGVWKNYDPRYVFQKHWEEKQKTVAAGLMPVADNYKKKLLSEGVSEQKIRTVPVSVDTQHFSFNKPDRNEIRKKLNISSDGIVGIYVGKFGDIYYDQEAFDIFRKAFDFFGLSFRLILLTPNSIDEVKAKLLKIGIDPAKVFTAKVAHHEVPQYLSASDFAFSTIKPAACRKYCSPTKNGEYWANGLPIILTEGVGDDSDIIKNEGGGAVFNLEVPGSIESALHEIAEIISDPGCRDGILKLAENHRSLKKAESAYQYFFAMHNTSE